MSDPTTPLSQADIANPTDEHRMLRESLKAFVEAEVEPQAADFDRREIFNRELFQKLGEMGLLGLTVSPDYGGAGMDAVAVVLVHEELASSDPGFTLAYLAHSLLCANNLEWNAETHQKQKYLPKLCTGEWLGAMAMSEPDAGTDVLGMQTRAEPVGSGYQLTGRKMWITNGVVDDQNTPADVVIVYARTGLPASKEISTFIVEAGNPGYSVGQKIRDKLGMRASNTAELVFDRCELRSDQLIGALGGSLEHMMRNLEIERLGLAAMSLGMARRALRIMVQYAGEREAFGKALRHFGQIQKYIADSYAEYKAAHCFIYQTAQTLRLDRAGQRLDCDATKLFAATVAKNIADRAIQVLGGYGYVGEYVVERLWRDAKLIEIGGGTIESHQKNISSDLAKMMPSHL